MFVILKLSILLCHDLMFLTAKIDYSCDFESNLCNWAALKKNNRFQWKRGLRTKPKLPTVDHTSACKFNNFCSRWSVVDYLYNVKYMFANKTNQTHDLIVNKSFCHYLASVVVPQSVVFMGVTCIFILTTTALSNVIKFYFQYRFKL